MVLDLQMEHWRQVAPMPDGWVAVETIKEYILSESFPMGLMDNTIIGFSKPYYRPLDPSITTPMIWKDKTNQEPYDAPNFTCEDYTQSVIGMFNHDRRTANMPIFKMNVLKSIDPIHPHACIAFWYEGKLWYFEPMSDYYGPLPTNWTLVAISG